MTNTITVSRELVEQALSVLQMNLAMQIAHAPPVVEELRTALSQPQQEPTKAITFGKHYYGSHKPPQQERTCGTCKFYGESENVPCMKCGGFNKWKPLV